jgi:hypothetical protein
MNGHEPKLLLWKWRERLDARIDRCPACGEWRWDRRCPACARQRKAS